MHHRNRLLLSLLSVVLGLATSTVLAALQIVPGGTWTASNGEHLNAHGAGIIQVNNTFYLIGEDKSQGSSFFAVNCYSSVDLVQWTYEGALLSRRTTSSGDLGPNRIIERPKVIYNDLTKKYVMWMHVDSSNYGDAKVGVATSDTVCGKSYEYHGSFRPLGMESRDIGLFKDDDGRAYLLTEDRKNGLRINPLTPDYLSISGTTSTHLFPTAIESPALLKLSSGRYFLFGSHLTGWSPNDNVYTTSTNLSGPWSDWQIFADKGSNTYASQTSFILNYGGPGNGNIMYMGDRWHSTNLQSSSYIWLPLTITDTTTVVLKNRASWIPNAQSGLPWTESPAENSYEGEQGSYAGGAKEVSCAGCSGGKAAGYIGGTSTNGSITISGVQSNSDDGGKGGVTTIQIRYKNGDTNPRYASVRVNGGAPQKVAFEGTAGDVGVSSLVVKEGGLRKGDGNTIVVSGWEGAGWGPDVDRVVVPVE